MTASILCGCLSLDGELAADRSLVPTPHVGLLTGPSGSCAATLIRTDKVLALARCVADPPANGVTFIARDGEARDVRALSVGSLASEWGAFDQPEFARLTLASPLDGPTVGSPGFAPDPSEAWLDTFDLQGQRVVLSCAHEGDLMRPECEDQPRLPGGLIYAIRPAGLVGLSLDLGPEELALPYDDILQAPDAMADLSVHISRDTGVATLELAVADPRSGRIAHFRAGWGRGWSVPFEPVSVALFAGDVTTDYVAASSDGRLWTSHRYGEVIDAPIAARKVELLDEGEVTVLWIADAAGGLCRREWLPRPRAWQCAVTVDALRDFAVLALDGQELVVIAGASGVAAMTYRDGSFGAIQAWGLEGEATRAVVLGRLGDRTPYGLVAHGDDALSIRVRVEDEGWSEWEPFSAGRLLAVEAMAGGRPPGAAMHLFAAAGGRLYHTLEIDGTFTEWR